MIFIQKGKLTEVTHQFYKFQNKYKLTYNDVIQVKSKEGKILYNNITVSDYLKQLPEV